MSEQDTSETHGSSIQSVNGNHFQETPKPSNTLRFNLLLISIIISLLVAPFFLTNNIFNICVFFATFTTLIFALTDLIIYLSKEPPHPTAIHINSAEKGNKKTNKNSLSIAVKKVVHYTRQCRVAVSRVMDSIFQHKWLIKTFAIALSFPVASKLTEHWKEITDKITAVLEFFIINNKSLGISILITILFILIIFFKNMIAAFQKIMASLTSKYFVFTLASLAIIGALSALLIPSYTSWFREPGYTSTQQDSTKENPENAQNTPTPTASPTGNKAAEVEQKSTSDLRLHLLYITGGIIAILGLIETNRKNSQDHIRQVHAARRERYIEAVDKLSSEQAPVRLGGVYALVGLVDEWLDDDNIDENIRTKEGQIIINNLCSYIRSPFPLAEKIEEYEARKQLEELKKKGLKSLSLSDYWQLNHLNKRFTDANDKKKIKRLTADYANIQEEQDVRRTIFVEMSKRSSTFPKNNKGEIIKTVPGIWSDFNFDFSRAPIFYPLSSLTIEKGNFSSAKFYSNADFSGAAFTQTADFSGATFTQTTDFSWATFTQTARFRRATFTQTARFIGATFTQTAHFIGATFTQNARFSRATFTQNAHFSRATFTQNADFSGAAFAQTAHFRWATFAQTANFRSATFASNVDFRQATFERSEPTFATKLGKAQFSAGTSPQNYMFSVAPGSKPINCKPATLLGKTFIIPLGTVLFAPDSPKDQLGNYAVQSDPAK